MRLISITAFGLYLSAASAAAAQETSEAALCEQVVGNSATSEQARATARGIIIAKSGTAGAAFLNGCLLFAEGKPNKAANFFEVAVSEPKSHYFDWLGRAYGDQAQNASKLRQPFLARKTKNAFEQAVVLDADNLAAREFLVQFYQLAPGVMGGSKDKARAQLQAIRSRNAYRGALASAGYSTRAKDFSTAEREYLALTRSHPDSLAPWNGVFALQIQGKRWSDAFATVESLRARPDRTAIADYMTGRLAAVSGEQLDRGEEAVRRYLTIAPAPNQPTHANAHFRLAQIMHAKKDVPAARREYQEVLRLQPNHQDAKKALDALK